ncbi:hypothetical protein AURDEDRAFT_168981 [Auricularia subglabra TFB-10046 SS5]|nr:hypothetical protein AURDEDRAFT_168981 [Auricularia subglabra TFB-10046 SS5]
MSSLPPEMLHEILSHCRDDTLCAAALVSKRVRKVAEKVLYNLIHLDSVQRCTDLLAALEAAPGHAQLVRGLRLFGVNDMDPVTELLLLLPKLTRLNVTLWCEGFGLPVGGYAFRLRRLRIFGEFYSLTAEEYVAFFEQQDQLEVLEFVSSTPSRRWELLCARAEDKGAPRLLPKLRVLQARMDVILAFLSRGRPELQEIRVQTRPDELAPESTTGDVAPALCAALAAAAVNLHALLIEIMIYRRNNFEKFQKAVPDLAGIPSFYMVKRFVLHLVGTAFEEILDGRDLDSAFAETIVPGVLEILPKVEVWTLMLHPGTLDNPTLLDPHAYMRAPSGIVPDWHILHPEFCDQEFFCSK